MTVAPRFRTLEIADAANDAKMAKYLHRWRDDIQVSLKTLSILYQQEEKAPQELAPELGSAQPAAYAAASADSLYHSMLMLNSALLKALHVADSCQLHCQRECPGLPGVQEQEDASGSSDEPEERFPGRRYRKGQCRLEAVSETVSAIKLEVEEKEGQKRKLQEECRDLENGRAVSTPPAGAPGSDAAADVPPMSPSKAACLRGHGLVPEKQQGESSAGTSLPLDPLRQAIEKLTQDWKDQSALRSQREQDAVAAEKKARAARQAARRARRAAIKEKVERFNDHCSLSAGDFQVELAQGDGSTDGGTRAERFLAGLSAAVQRFSQQLVEEEAEAQRREQRLRDMVARGGALQANGSVATDAGGRRRQDDASESPSPTAKQGGLSASARRQGTEERPKRAAWERLLQEVVSDDHPAAILAGGSRQEQPMQQTQQPPPQQQPHQLFTRVASASSFADQIRGRAGSFSLGGNVRVVAAGGGVAQAAEVVGADRNCDGVVRSPERGTFARTSSASAALPPRPKWLDPPQWDGPVASASSSEDPVRADVVRRMVSGPSLGMAVPVEVCAVQQSYVVAPGGHGGAVTVGTPSVLAPKRRTEATTEEAVERPQEAEPLMAPGAIGGSPERSGPLYAPQCPMPGLEAESRPSARSRPTGGSTSRGGSVAEMPPRSKPFVVCSSVRSHHASAQVVSRTAQRTNHGAVSEDRQFTKAALRLSKNPCDTQALGKLASLLGGSRSQKTVGVHSPEPGEETPVAPHGAQMRAPSPDAGLPTPMPTGSSSSTRIDTGARSVSPVCTAASLGGEAFVVQAARAASAQTWHPPAWHSARATFPTAEQRSQHRVACGGAASPVVRNQRPPGMGPRVEDGAGLQQQQQQQQPQPLSARACNDRAEAQHTWRVRDGRSQSPEAPLQRLDVVRSASPPLSLCSAAAAAVAAASGSPRAAAGPALQVAGAPWPAWPPSTRATWPTPEHRAQMAAAGLASATAHYACSLRPSPGPSPRSGG